MDWTHGLAVGMAIPTGIGFVLLVTKTGSVTMHMRKVNSNGKRLHKQMRSAMDMLIAAERDFQLVLHDPHGPANGREREQAIRCLELDIDECSKICSEYDKLYDKVSSSRFKSFLWYRANQDLDLSYGVMKEKITSLLKSVEIAKLIGSNSTPSSPIVATSKHDVRLPPYSQEDLLGRNGIPLQDPEHPPALPQRPSPTLGNPQFFVQTRSNHSNNLGQTDGLPQFRDQNGNPIHGYHMSSYRRKLKAKRITSGAAVVGAGLGFVLGGPVGAVAVAGIAATAATEYVDSRRARYVQG